MPTLLACLRISCLNSETKYNQDCHVKPAIKKIRLAFIDAFLDNGSCNIVTCCTIGVKIAILFVMATLMGKLHQFLAVFFLMFQKHCHCRSCGQVVIFVRV